MQNVLITGMNGFVGSALAERLLKQKGIRVVGLIRDKNFKSRRDLLDKTSIVYGDLRDIDSIRYTMSHYEIDTVFHLGAVTILRQAVVDPQTCYGVNVMGTVNILEAARSVGAKKIVVASSDKAYGTYKNLPYVETMPVQASADSYSTSKACTDLIAQSYASTYDMDVSIVRAGNIYGPGDRNMSRLIPRSILRILEGIQPQLYKGVAQYKREFMYIDDVIDAYLTVQDRGLKGEAYNIGGSGFQSILDTVKLIAEITNHPDLEPEIIDKDFIEIKEQYLDPTKIKKLGWKCNFDIRRGLEESVKWYDMVRNTPEYFHATH